MKNKIISKTEKSKTHKKFFENPKIKLKLINEFSKLLPLANYPITDNELKKIKTLQVMTDSVVCCVQEKTIFGRSILRLFKENDDIKIKNILWEPKQQGSSNISIEYLNKVFKIINIIEEKVNIETGKDYIIKLETNDFIFLIAPRVGDE